MIQEEATLLGHKEPVLHLDHRHELSRLASASEVRRTDSRRVAFGLTFRHVQDGLVRIWDLRTNKTTSAIAAFDKNEVCLIGKSQTVLLLTWSKQVSCVKMSKKDDFTVFASSSRNVRITFEILMSC